MIFKLIYETIPHNMEFLGSIARATSERFKLPISVHAGYHPVYGYDEFTHVLVAQTATKVIAYPERMGKSVWETFFLRS